jgi:hypothetical protein
LNAGFPDDLPGCKQRVRPALEIIRSNLNADRHTLIRPAAHSDLGLACWGNNKGKSRILS